MRRTVTRAAAFVAAVGVAGALGAGAAGAAAARAQSPAGASSPAASGRLARPGARLWIQRFNGPANGQDAASSVAVSPDGGMVFVTGQTSAPNTSSSGYLTAAYNAATGAPLWTARYSGPGDFGRAQAIVVSPDGATVFVTGTIDQGSGNLGDFGTVAYRASDGKQLWAARFDDPSHGGDNAAALSVARDGSMVFVTGTSWSGSASGIATVAYRTADGTQLWAASWSPPRMCCNYYAATIASPGGNRVLVTGHVQSNRSAAEYGTVAYNATTGARLWARRYPGQGATSLAVSPDLTRVYVTGESHFDYGTIAYSARTGARLWARFYGSRLRTDGAASVAVSPGGTVLVTGTSWGSNATGDDYATLAYSPGGVQLWARRYNGPGGNTPPNGLGDVAHTVAVPGNGKAYITGISWGGTAAGYDYATIAYNVRTGALVWLRRYNGPASGFDNASSLAVRGGRVFVTGDSAGKTSEADYATIAYQG